MRKYQARITNRSSGATHSQGAVQGQILEDGILIGTFLRRATQDNFIPPLEYKFRSDASRARFQDFADSLSIEETIELLAE